MPMHEKTRPTPRVTPTQAFEAVAEASAFICDNWVRGWWYAFFSKNNEEITIKNLKNNGHINKKPTL